MNCRGHNAFPKPAWALVIALQLAAPALQAQLAFPTAEGFGAESRGGRGGVVIYVDNLDDSGPSWPSCATTPKGCSLRSALRATVPRNVLFRVGGTIELLSRIDLGADQSYLTVAGHTAPGDGIQVKNFGFALIGTHDVILRHLKARVGYAAMTPQNFGSHDSLAIVDSTDVIVDHCSLQWGPDETLSVWQGSERVTVQWTIISEGADLDELGFHLGGSKGLFAGGQPRGYLQTLTAHHNLISDQAARSPLIGSGAAVDIRNNVVYNWGDKSGALLGSYQLRESSQAIIELGSPQINFVANYYKPGPDSKTDIGYLGGLRTKIFLDGNVAPNCPGTCADPWNSMFNEQNPVINTMSPGTGVRPLQTCSGRCVPADCHDCYPAGDGVCVDGPSFVCSAGKCAEGPFKGKVCSQNSHCRDNGRGCEIRGTTLAEKFRTATPHAAPPVVTTSAQVAYEAVLDNVGATLPVRDSLDLRMVNEVRTGTGAIGCGATGIACFNPGDWPSLRSGTPPVDTDRDGMPDAWEIAQGLRPNDPSDRNADANGNGYTDLEDYLNELAGSSPTPPPPVPSVQGLRRDDAAGSD